MTSVKLLTVFKAAERATMTVSKVTENAKDYNIEHVGNVTSVSEVADAVKTKGVTAILVAPVFSGAEVEEITTAAKGANSEVKILAIPEDVIKEKGPEGAIEYIKSKFPNMVK